MVMLGVLAMLIVAMVLSTNLGGAWSSLNQLQRYDAGREANYQVARSAFELALQLLEADNNNVDGPGDLWAAGPQTMQWQGRTLTVSIQDEERRIPINALLGNATTTASQQQGSQQASDQQQAMQGVLSRFLDRAGLAGDQATASLLDWIDADSIPRPGGAEVSISPKLPVKNGPLDSLSELQYIRHWGPPDLPKPPPLAGSSEVTGITQQTSSPEVNQKKSQAPSNWSDWLTLHSSGKININTAPEEILRCLDAQMSEAVVSQIVAKRQTRPFRSQQDLTNITGIDPDMAFRLGRVVTFTSSYFRILVIVDHPPGRVRLDAIVHRGSGKPTVVSWEVN